MKILKFYLELTLFFQSIVEERSKINFLSSKKQQTILSTLAKYTEDYSSER